MEININRWNLLILLILVDCALNSKVQYYWKVSKWTSCSQTCGRGESIRDINCVNTDLPSVTVDKRFCLQAKQKVPEMSRLCAEINCPPVFVPGKWSECKSAIPCKKGRRIREIMCRQLMSNGRYKNVPKSKCYRSMRSAPPKRWEQCINYGELKKKKCKLFSGLSKLKKSVKFILPNSTHLYQLRQMRRVKLTIGETGYLLPWSRVIIACPVKNYFPHDLKWKYGNSEYKYQGKRSKTSMVKVDRKGRLKIKRLSKRQHEGTWWCIAGKKNTSAKIIIRDPSVAYKDWIQRRHLIEKSQKESRTSFSNKEKYHYYSWFMFNWSKCVLNCDSSKNLRNYGKQSRMVQCELISSRFYKVVNGDQCSCLKPVTIRNCSQSYSCSKWNAEELLLNDNKIKCTNECVKVGEARRNVKFSCYIGDQKVEDQYCATKLKPELLCDNKLCQVEWQYGAWSKCSRRCGKSGYQTRSFLCVWSGSKKPAGSLCHSNGLAFASLRRKCYKPSCKLGCTDLRPTCFRRRNYCNNYFYRYICCQTCNKLLQ